MSNSNLSTRDGGQIGPGERALSVAVGLSLAAAAAQPRPNRFLSVLALAAGSYLAYRGATGRCPIKAGMASA